MAQQKVKRVRDLNEGTWKEFMSQDEKVTDLKPGDLFIFKNPKDDMYDGYTVGLYERYNDMGACDIRRLGVFWLKDNADIFVDGLTHE